MTNAQLQALLKKHPGTMPVEFLDVGSDSDTISYKITGVQVATVTSGTGPGVKKVAIEGVPNA